MNAKIIDPCAVEGCLRFATGTGHCKMHKRRLQSTGRIDRPSAEERFWAKVNKDGPGGCWVWTASLIKGYGCLARTDESTLGPSKLAHRITWFLTNGSVPDGLDLDHLCRVRACCNPDHLEPVTRLENVRRGIGAEATRALGVQRRAQRTACAHGHSWAEFGYLKKQGWPCCKRCDAIRAKRRRAAGTHARTKPLPAACPHGHPYDEANTSINKMGSPNCRTCARLRFRRRQERVVAGLVQRVGQGSNSSGNRCGLFALVPPVMEQGELFGDVA